MAESKHFDCEICGQEFRNKVDIRNHMLKEHEESGGSCPLCDLQHVTLNELKWHVNTAHSLELSPDLSNVGVPKDKHVLVEVNAISYSELEQPGKKAESSLIDAYSDTADVNIGTKEFPITLGPFKKCVHKSKGQHSDNQSVHVSAPDYPNCDFSGLNRGAMTKTCDCDHIQVVANVKKQSLHVPLDFEEVLNNTWNTGTPIPKKQKTSNSPQEALFGDKKQYPHQNRVGSCPICGLHSYDVQFLTHHVNTVHLISDNKQMDLVADASGVRQIPNMPDDQGGPSNKSFSSETDTRLSCPVCGLYGMDAAALSVHVECHFEDGHQLSYSGDWLLARKIAEEERQLQETKEKETFKQLQVKYGMDNSESYIQHIDKDLERAVVKGKLTVSDYYQQRGSLLKSIRLNIDDGKTCTTGLIPKMLRYYTDQTTQGLSFVKLCCATDHYFSSYGDKSWGCGYRNLQMLLSSLVRFDKYRQVIFNGQKLIPSITKIQQLIEAAWDKGFDHEGREQLGGHLIKSCKWIGATEIVTLLSSLGAKCSLFDFHTPSSPGGTHPAMFKWVQEYFGEKKTAPNFCSHKDKEENIRSNKMPLYLQHEGHSRTIIGCEVYEDKSVRLLLFDPSIDMQSLGSASIDASAMRPIRKNLAQMKAKQYQIVRVDGLITSEQDYEKSKTLTSIRIP